MPETGQTISHYRILEKIGVGGMGEVYLADDLSLDRKVALKFLPDVFTGDPERMARFEREAKLLASLNHPNIAAIYGLEQADGKRFLIMEYVSGETLQSRISKGALSVEEALAVCRQIAEGLEAAHEKGVIHRDLKPANVMITGEEGVKILDFGLAKALLDDGQSVDSSKSPTITEAMTQPGVVLGTAAYMSPEQAKGKTVNKRADIWAFGCILYECLTGKRAFEGETVTETLAAVIRAEPDLKSVPAKVRLFLQRCLEKDPTKRLRDLGEALAWMEVAPESVIESTPAKRPLLALSIAAILIIALLIILWAPWRVIPPAPALTQFQITLPDEVTLSYDSLFSLSPDGRHLVFAAYDSEGTKRLWIRGLDSIEVKALPGTELGLATSCFWSPDSRFIAFDAGGKLKKVNIAGGPPETICDLTGYALGGSWNRNDVIIFGTLGGSLMRVSASGGNASPLTELDPTRQEIRHTYPRFLPDGSSFLYFCASTTTEKSGVYMGSLDPKPEEKVAKQLLATPAAAAYMPSVGSVPGQLIFIRDQVLMAQPFDNNRMELIGEAISIADNVGSFYENAYFSISENGILSYRPGDSITGSGGTYELVWMDREGKKIASASEPGGFSNFRLSGDDTKVIFDRTESGSLPDVHVLDLNRNVSSRLTFNPATENLPIWSPDDLQVLFPSNRNGSFDLYLKAATGAGQEEVLVELGTPTGWGTDWSKDGRFILCQKPGGKTGQDLWIAPQFDDQKPYPYLQTEFDEQDGTFSPDGKWIAYVSDETGRNEIYVQSFPLSGSKFQVSSGGANEPYWSTDGTELFYMTADRNLVAVPIKLSPIFEPGLPKRLFSIPVVTSQRHCYAVSSDGKRFLVMNPIEEETESYSSMRVILNWPSLLEQ